MRDVPSLDVEPYRGLRRRTIRIRHSAVPAIVLGSTQPDGVVSAVAATRAGVAVLRRRTGGGAVWIDPTGPIWVDLWVPRADPLFDDDVVRAATWVGDTWVAALGSFGVGQLGVHRGPPIDTGWSQVCFAGVGPGEVVAGSRKVVGVAQWRSRQGALFHCAAYRNWDPVPLLELLAIEPARRIEAVSELSRVAMGIDELAADPSGAPVESSLVESTLVDCLPLGEEWDVVP
jgi:lipoate-protein ligase A